MQSRTIAKAPGCERELTRQGASLHPVPCITCPLPCELHSLANAIVVVHAHTPHMPHTHSHTFTHLQSQRKPAVMTLGSMHKTCRMKWWVVTPIINKREQEGSWMGASKGNIRGVTIESCADAPPSSPLAHFMHSNAASISVAAMWRQGVQRQSMRQQ